MRVVFLGLSVTSSWGNGHATIFRALLRALRRQGHDTLFLERDVPWYAANRDLEPGADPTLGPVVLYAGVDELRDRHAAAVRGADLVVVGSYVPEGVAVARWATATADGLAAFYDIDTPVTLAALRAGTCEYLDAETLRRFGLYLTFTGGPVLRELEEQWGAAAAAPLYCCVDAEAYAPVDDEPDLDLGYLGTYSDDRQPGLERLLLGPARRLAQRRFAVAGPQYPKALQWPANVERIEHVPPPQHRAFYGRQRFTLNLTRAAMTAAGFSPSVRLFEAAACGVPIITDAWPGLSTFFVPDREVIVARDGGDVEQALTAMSDTRRRAIAAAARRRVLAEHTADHRAAELVGHVARPRSSAVSA